MNLFPQASDISMTIFNMSRRILAGLGFGATQMIGENSGIYVGYNLDTGRNIYLQPSLASQGIKGSVTNALASALLVH